MTARELARKDHLRENTSALRLKRKHAGGFLAVTAVKSTFSSPLADLHGQQQATYLGADWELDIRGARLFGEAVQPLGLDGAWLSGIRIRGKKINLTMLARRYGSGFASLRATGFSAYSGSTRNEWGLFLATVWKSVRRIRLEAHLDRHRRLRGEGAENLPDRGERAALYISHPLAENRLQWTWSASRRLEDGSHLKHRSRVRARIIRQMGHSRIGLWAERSSAFDKIDHNGFALGMDATWKSPSWIKTSIWLNAFSTSSYGARIYTFEADVWGGPLLLALHGRGMTGGVRTIWKLRPLKIAIRYSLKDAGKGLTTGWAVQMGVSR